MFAFDSLVVAALVVLALVSVFALGVICFVGWFVIKVVRELLELAPAEQMEWSD